MSYMWHQFSSPYYKELPALHSVVFAPLSSNNERALQPIWKNLKEDIYSVMWENDDTYMPVRYMRFWSTMYIWPLIWLYLRSKQEDKLKMRTYFYEYFNTIGYVITLTKLLRYNDVKMVVLANDHCSYTRAMLTVTKELGITSIYTQHSSVAKTFPPLSFDYSFLDGEESYSKYVEAGMPKGHIYISGNTRFDILAQHKALAKQNSKRIGIATNTMDSDEVIKSLCVELIRKGYKEIVVRPHPRQDFDPTWYSDHGIMCSNSKIENPFEFLSLVDILIAGESGIHLDAAMMGVRSICYSTSGEKPLDWYSYIKNGLITYAANMEELLALLSNKNADRQKSQQAKLRWYNAAYGTKHDGHIGEMLADFIRFEQNGDIAKFDEKYGFVEREIKGYNVKIYKE